MIQPKTIKLTFLGQAGVLFESPEISWVVDPYLSNSVEVKYGERFKVQNTFKFNFETLIPKDLKYCFITHEHLDHLDPVTLSNISKRTGNLNVIAPKCCLELIRNEETLVAEVAVASEKWIPLINGLEYRAVPAAHPTLDRDGSGDLRYLGYLWRIHGVCIYHSGDTSPDEEIFESLANEAIDLAILPINEKNFFREKAGIIGNMSVREACLFAKKINSKQWVPIHWDMFNDNRAYRDELSVISKLESLDKPAWTWLEPGHSLTLKGEV